MLSFVLHGRRNRGEVSPGVMIRLDFSFFAALGLLLVFDRSGCGILSFIACLCHEAGHIIILTLQKNPPRRITFYGGGIMISGCGKRATVPALLAGSFVNILLFLIFFVFSDRTNIFPLLFASSNLIVGVFNLLPIDTLDGGQLLDRLTLGRMPPAAARIIRVVARIAAFMLCLAMIILSIVCGYFNPSFLLVLFYIFIMGVIVKL